jgi:hypothetical protein
MTDTHHERTKAAKTTTQLENAKTRPPSVAQVLEAQQRGTTERIDEHGNVKVSPQLPAPPELTEAQRAENLRKNMAAIGTRPMTYIYFEGVKNQFEIGGEKLPSGGLYVCFIRQTESGFRRFIGGKGGTVEFKMRRLDQPQLTRDDLEGGYEEKDSEYGRRCRWQDYIVLPLIDANNGGGELYGFETRNVTSWWAAKGLIGRCTDHPMFLRGLSPIIKLEVKPYKHPKYGMRGKPLPKICGWASADGSTTAEPQSPKPKLADEMNDELSDFA